MLTIIDFIDCPGRVYFMVYNTEEKEIKNSYRWGDRAVFNWVSKVIRVLLYFALWLVKTFRATFSTNQE